MDRLATTDKPDETGVSSVLAANSLENAASARVTVRYWAAIKAAAGRSQDEAMGASVEEVLAAVRDLHRDNPRFGQVLGICSILLGDRPLGTADLRQVAVQHGDVIDVLPPFAGG